MLIALVAIWALAEAAVFFIVADVPIMALAAKGGIRAGIKGAAIAAICAALGGAIVWQWIATDPQSYHALLLSLPGIDAQLISETQEAWWNDRFFAMLIGSFSGTPYKIYAAQAYASGFYSLPVFMALTMLARLPRFVLIALVSGWLGPKLRKQMGVRKFWSLFAAAWVLFYIWFWGLLG